MNFFVDGCFKSIGDIQDFGGFKKREFVIETDEQYPSIIKLEFHNDNVDVLNRFSIHEFVTIAFVVKGNEHQGKVYNNLIAIAIAERIDGKIEKEQVKIEKENKRIIAVMNAAKKQKK